MMFVQGLCTELFYAIIPTSCFYAFAVTFSTFFLDRVSHCSNVLNVHYRTYNLYPNYTKMKQLLKLTIEAYY